ncbi:MAG: Gfo/Idh/MocA family oxidoreductase, partial [Oscillospiraceae bacterium]
MKKLKVGIVGCGNIFPMHAYPTNDLETAEIVAICDNKKDRADAKAKDFNCQAYYDFETMIDQVELDVVHLCTPHYLHPPMAIYALNHGVNVMTEKPMGIDYESSKKMVETAKNNNKLLGVIFQNRYNAGSQLVKKLLNDGCLGKIKSAKCSITWDRSDLYYSYSDWKGTWDKEGGGVIIDQAIHTLDLMRWLIDEKIEYIDASIANRAHEKIEVEDCAEGVIKFKSGIFASFFAINYYSYDAPIEIELHCENGIAKIIENTATVKLNDGRQFYAEKNPSEIFDYGNVKDYWGVSHIKQIKNYYECLENGKVPYVPCESALETMKMICG